MIELPHILYFDGSCDSAGIAAYGWLLYSPENKLLSSGSGILFSGKVTTNNFAEYGALDAGIKHLKNQKTMIPYLLCKGDSLLVVNQLSGKWKCKNPETAAYVQQVRDQLDSVASRWEFLWIPRKENGDADRLSKLPYRHSPYTPPTRPKKKARVKNQNKKNLRRWKNNKKNERKRDG